MTDPKSFVNKVHVAISFGSPDDEVTREIMDELQALIKRLENAERGHDTTALALSEALNKLARVHQAVTKLEMARSDDPTMSLYPLLTVLSHFVESVEGALND